MEPYRIDNFFFFTLLSQIQKAKDLSKVPYRLIENPDPGLWPPKPRPLPQVTFGITVSLESPTQARQSFSEPVILRLVRATACASHTHVHVLTED